jgi:ribonuclease E
VAYYLLNRKKRDLAQIENDYDIAVTVKGKPSFLMNQLELEQVKREKPLQADASQMQAEAPITILDEPFEEISEEEIAEAAASAGQELPVGEEAKGKKKRRRKKKGKGETDTEAAPVPESAGTETETPPAESVQPELPAAEGEEPAEVPQTEEQKKKRRRRKRRGAKGPAPETADVGDETPGAAAEEMEPGPEAAAAEETEGDSAPVAAGEAAPSGEQKKKRRRRKRRGAKSQVQEVTTGEDTAAAGEGEDVTAALAARPAEKEAATAAILADETGPAGGQKKPRRKRSGPKAPAAVPSEAEGNQPGTVEAPVTVPLQSVEEKPPAPAKPVKKSGTGRKKLPATSPEALPEAASEPVAAAAGPTEAPVAPKKSRSKKSTLPEPVAVPLPEEAAPAPVKKARRTKEATVTATVSTPEAVETMAETAVPKRPRAPRKKKPAASEPVDGD